MIDSLLTKKEWSGTATALCESLKKIDLEADVAPRTITKILKSNTDLFKKKNITIVIDRDRDKRTITLIRQGEQEDIF